MWSTKVPPTRCELSVDIETNCDDVQDVEVCSVGRLSGQLLTFNYSKIAVNRRDLSVIIVSISIVQLCYSN